MSATSLTSLDLDYLDSASWLATDHNRLEQTLTAALFAPLDMCAGYWADYCKVQHLGSGLCVAMAGWPGQLRLQSCSNAWNGGNMWRVCVAPVSYGYKL